jgi:hypothetical protein
MSGYYASDAYLGQLASEPPRPLAERMRGTWALTRVLWYAGPFFREVFFRPMDLVDASGRRIREAFRHIQLLSRRQRVRRLPFLRFMTWVQDLYNAPVVGKVLGGILLRILGIDPRVAVLLYTDADLARAETMSFEAMGQEALSVKEVPSATESRLAHEGGA